MSEDKSKANKGQADQVDESDEDGVQRGGPLSKIMPPDMTVWKQARNLITDKGVRVEELATACVQDPIIVLELIRVANALYFSGGRSAITTVQNAIVRLGSDVVLEHLQKIGSRSQIEDETVAHWFAHHRSRGKRVAITARILSQIVDRSLDADCQTAALFTSLGEMLAVFHLEHQYTDLAGDSTRNGLNYHLATKMSFDVEKIGIKYLRKQGIPDSMIFALDRDAVSRNPERSIMRPICFAAAELVEAFDTNRWEKVAPGKTLPTKSHLRLLKLDHAQYLKVYERVAEYLFTIKLAEQKLDGGATEAEDQGTAGEAEEDDNLAADIEKLLSSTPEEKQKTETKPAAKVAKPADQKSKPETKVESVAYSLGDAEDQFSLKPKNDKKVARVKSGPAKVAPPKLTSSNGTRIVSAIADMFEDAGNSEELLASLLDRLINPGPFEKAALVVVSRDRKHAIVVAARGPSIGNGQKINLDDPLSPLAQCFSKVQSFGNKPNEASPFGSKAFAVAPIQADHDTPVALYADCGNEGSLTFEARRIFRTVVDILNQKLPTIPGGIPVELA